MAGTNYPNPSTPDRARPRGDVEVALDDLGKKFVSEIYTRDDGARVVLHAPDLKPYELAALDPKLASFVKEAVEVVEPASFKDYILAFAGPAAVCFASLNQHQILAVLDYHGRAREGEADEAKPNRKTHQVKLLCPWDVDYAKWREIFGTGMNQTDFANVLEDLVHTISEPAVADLAEAIDDLRIDRSVRFKSKVNRRNGSVQIAYEDVEEGGGEGGEMKLPEVVKIVVPMFQGGDLIQLEAKLRYNIDKGKVTFTLMVPGLDKIERDQFRRIGEDVRSATNTPVFYTA